jgi:AraC family transcriptional regulator, regulatory protein of adaptative response / methylated-DNA-[protein]-cysteine methyltransferase
MKSEFMSDYKRIAKAITYIQENVGAQPELEDIARHVNLSPYHFQRLFKDWAGTTPKRFLQVLTLELGKQLLDQQHSVFEAAEEIGLSSASRLHDHFVQLEAMTPGEYKNKGSGLEISYATHESLFGTLFVAQTPRGICRTSFIDHNAEEDELKILSKNFPLASFIEDKHSTKNFADTIFAKDQTKKFKLHIAGTNFQLAVWRALLRIPSGQAISYGELAAHLKNPGASRAVGTAIGANPVAFLIPCHRVIQQSGALGGYRWGTERKQAIQVWEKL